MIKRHIRKVIAACLIAMSVILLGCQEEKKSDAPDLSKSFSDPNMLRMLRGTSNPVEALFMSLPPVGISMWSERYHDHYRRYPESKEQLKVYVDAHPEEGPPIFWESIEDLSFGSPESKKLDMKMTMVFKNSDGQNKRVSFPLQLESDPNKIPPDMKLIMEKEIEKIILK
jgi:hypothetical protein